MEPDPNLPPRVCARDPCSYPRGKFEDTYRFAGWPRGPRWPLWPRIPLEARGAKSYSHLALPFLHSPFPIFHPPPTPRSLLTLSSRSLSVIWDGPSPWFP